VPHDVWGRKVGSFGWLVLLNTCSMYWRASFLLASSCSVLDMGSSCEIGLLDQASIERMERQGLVVREQAAGDGRGMTATLTEAGLERLHEAYPHHLASVRANAIDHLDGLDLIAFAKAVGSFATAEPERYSHPRARRAPALRRA